ncbi:glycerol kinase GlpK [Thiofilum flexile]|uniref:glycerol kinase GlpK n=1 Tax=Thiofilum flexile TaxID=125627 RepID=UPI00037470A9|nr:glycerol kinase GlpK [Thiofilum flexile]
MSQYIVAIDQGTTSSRSIVFNENLHVIALAQQEFPQHFPQSGWVEHDPNDLLHSTLGTFKQALANAHITLQQVASIGITNQRETVVVWDRSTGKAIYNAIVWQDRRTADYCQTLKDSGAETLIREKTGLLADPYFSGTEIRWILNHVTGARAKAEKGQLAMGTIDTWLIWHLTGGKVHATDATNASRTLLYNIHTHQWDDELLELLDIPRSLLPEVKDSAADFGTTDAQLLGAAIPISGVAGDQHAAVVGQACFKAGMMKSTYGTGCFALLNTGEHAVLSQNKLLTTLAYQLNGKATYALEGSIFVAGAAVQWLRDGLKVIQHAHDTQALAEQADPHQQIYLVPAFVGLGAPYWDAQARGALYGLTRNTGAAELARATLESIGYQTRDLLEAMQADSTLLQATKTVLRVDGGMTASNWTMQFLADILNSPVDRPQVLETTAMGAAWLAGYQQGICPDPDTFAAQWALDQRFEPHMSDEVRQTKYAGWKEAVRRTLTPS